MPLVLLALLLVWAPGAAAQTLLLVTASDLHEKHPLPGARIQVTRRDNGQVVATAITDSRGAAIISVATSRSYRVRASLPGYFAYEAGMIHAVPGNVAIRLLFSAIEPFPEMDPPLAPTENGVIVGVVSTAEGAPLEHVWVAATATDGIGGDRALTRANGSYRLAVPPGTYTVSAGGEMVAPPWFRDAPAYTTRRRVDSAPVPVTSRGGVRVDLQLPEGPQLFNVTVTVVDGAGRRVPGATVKVFGRRDEPFKGPFSGSSLTGADGSATLSPMTPGEVTIVAMAARTPEGLVGTTSVEIVDAPLDDVTVLVLPGASFSGRIDFARRATPMHAGGGLHVLFDPPGFPSSWSSEDPGLMKPDGTFLVRGLIGERCLRLADVPAGWHVKDAIHQGLDLANRVIRFEPGDVYADVTIRIERGTARDPQSDCEP